MVMKPEPVFEAVESVLGSRYVARGATTRPPSPQTQPVTVVDARQGIPVILLTPQGRVFTQRVAEELSRQEHIALICGRYEAADMARAFTAFAMVVADSITRRPRRRGPWGRG